MSGRWALGWALVLGAVVVWGCNSTHIGNPPEGPGEPTAAALHFRSSSRAPTSSARLAAGGEEAAIWVVIRDIELLPAKARDDVGEGEGASEGLRLEGPFVAELLSGRLLGGDALLEGVQGDYRKVRFKLRAADASELPEGAPAGLVGRSLYMTGRRSDGAPFEVFSVKPEALRLEARDAPIRLDAELSSLIVGFDTASWLLPEELAGLEAPITISEEEHGELLRRLERRLKGSTRVYPDADQDGALSDEERSSPLAEPEDEDDD